MGLFRLHICCVLCTLTHNLSLKVDFLFQSFLAITVSNLFQFGHNLDKFNSVLKCKCRGHLVLISLFSVNILDKWWRCGCHKYTIHNNTQYKPNQSQHSLEKKTVYHLFHASHRTLGSGPILPDAILPQTLIFESLYLRNSKS